MKKDNKDRTAMIKDRRAIKKDRRVIKIEEF